MGGYPMTAKQIQQIQDKISEALDFREEINRRLKRQDGDETHSEQFHYWEGRVEGLRIAYRILINDD
jgi:hypothetical protein